MLNDEKKFYERFYSLHRDHDLMSVLNRFGVGVFRRSSVLEGFNDFVKDNKFSGNLCVEIGTCKGLTSVILSRYFNRVVSIDTKDDPDKYAIREYLGIDNIDFINIADNEEKKTFIDTLVFDAAYVDGDHAHDTRSDFDLVRRCGKVLFHEYWPAQPAVVKLVDSLSGVTRGDKFALWVCKDDFENFGYEMWTP